MNTSNQTYKELSTPYFKETFDCIDEIMNLHKTPFYLIGANAIALELLKEGIKPTRGTRDIDFAVMVSNMDDYEKICQDVIKKGYNRVDENYRFYSEKRNIVIDIQPFGQIEEQYSDSFIERKIDLHLLGFKEVLEESEQVYIEEKIANIPPLPGMIILKLIAWDDRPEYRENDLADILKIIQNYYDIKFNEIVEHHYDTFPEDDNIAIDQLLVGAEVIGRKAKLFLDKSNELSVRTHQILKQNLQSPTQSLIAKDWAPKLNKDIEYAFSVLKAFRKGLLKD
ncbi:MAG TPA: nucleotidyl transferase AbiEii/AbiGii toxin family protein [Dysgonamonadaceae bacterium]|nr:nucleotidyl transferase AbiEii/AbiGii toxin family protein [Dysgonamonadaceae bacterium]